MLICSAPLTPDADTAREWAERELSKGKYQHNSFLDKFLDWLLNQLRGTDPELGDGIPITQILVGAALALLLILIVFYLVRLVRSRQQRSATTQERLPLFDDERSAAELFAAADAASSAKQAVIERYRGIIRLLDEHKLLLVRPGMTALEASAAASKLLGNDALFASCADSFNRAYYSELEITPTQTTETVELAEYCQNAVAKISVTKRVGEK